MIERDFDKLRSEYEVLKRRVDRIIPNDIDEFRVALGVWMRIDSASIDGTNRRWAYTVTEVSWSSGYTWSAVTSGLTGTAYNTIEVPNGATGAFGNGTNSTNFTGTYNVVPIGTNAVVRAWYIGTALGVSYFGFSAVNQVDGACP